MKMIKTLCGAGLGLACASTMAQSSVTVAGTMDLAPRHVRNGSLGSISSEVSGSNATSKLIIRGSEDMGGGLSAGFYLDAPRPRRRPPIRRCGSATQRSTGCLQALVASTEALSSRPAKEARRPPASRKAMDSASAGPRAPFTSLLPNFTTRNAVGNQRFKDQVIGASFA
jgi:hypothetical protein